MKTNSRQAKPSPLPAEPRLKLRAGRSQLKLSSMPFAVINALSRSPELLRQCARIGLAAVVCAWLPSAVLAQDVSAPAETATKALGSPDEKSDRKKSYYKRSEVKIPDAPVAGSTASEKAPAAKATPQTSAATVSSKKEAVPSPKSYDAFRIVGERNIFDANRSARTRGRSSEDAAPAPKVESFALVGTMAYEKNSLAFFDSNNSAYRKTAKAGDTIGIHKLKRIGASQVTLEAEGKEVELKVGMQMRRESDGPWEAAVRTETFASAPTPGGGGSGERRPSFGGGDSSRSSRSSRGGYTRGPTPGGPPPDTSAPSSGGSDNDLLRRLMEKRKKEMN